MNRETAVNKLVTMSAGVGERFDLVQAGGGNTSVKFGESMLIKASGYLLSELHANKGFTEVNTQDVLSIMENQEVLNSGDKRSKDQSASELLKKTIVKGKDRPSIETYLHALLYTYTCHVHAIAVNVFTSHKLWETITPELYPNALLVPYETPGIELALLLKKKLEEYKESYGQIPKVIFLQNHGLIVSSDTYEEIAGITNEIVTRAEQLSGLDLSRYHMVNRISELYRNAFKTHQIAYLSEDAIIQDIITGKSETPGVRPFSPDGFVFCGYKVLELENLDEKDLIRYKKEYQGPPTLIRFNGHLFIMAADLKKAKMIEDVLKNNLLIANHLKNDLFYLPEEEINFLGNWEAEKYRQNLP
ncbi:class II aldolase/adducin family protein [Zeaxanthinibacter enoshimensis]|uniref:Rhamnose utilization protein RhaD (Predicted bifunctional aldolase and dehydrogenase) n=1 Tax=Zeaxanthinibacter enoshimensis TaxID=392009 RepID=A0A4R6TQP0_9FLAO|nr:class II aldolase/adducin family protein [Zeaxanthinibacter enoshimensis]TDQ32776.1 rhamnose utilization protein RhaD (predicted bifunctional aldolase and dehydrogenase) [Zeaxanthinibacter enoshimensis]